MPPRIPSCFLKALILLCLILTFAGCGTLTGPGSASFASVTIHNHSVVEIRAGTSQVFHEDGYTGGSTSQSQMVFQKEASRLATISRDGVVAPQSRASTMERVRLELVAM